LLEAFLYKPFELRESQDIEPSKDGGFARWDGTGMSLYREYQSLARAIGNIQYFRATIVRNLDEVRQNITNLQNQPSTAVNTSLLQQYRDEQAAIEDNIENLDKIINASSDNPPTVKDKSKAKTLYENFVKDIIPKKIIPILNQLKDTSSSSSLNDICSRLINIYNNILNNIPHIKSLLENANSIGKDIEKVLNRNFDCVIFKKADASVQKESSGGYFCKRKDRNIQPSVDVETKQRKGSSGTDGFYNVSEDVIDILNVFCAHRNIQTTEKQEKGVTSNKCIVFVSSYKMDFPTLGNLVKYIDLKEYPVDEEEAIILINFVSERFGIKIRRSLIEKLKQFIMGRDIVSALQIVRTTIYKSFDPETEQLNTSKVVDICSEIAAETASSISDLMVPFPVRAGAEAFVRDPNSECGRFFTEKFSQAELYRNYIESKYNILDEIDEIEENFTQNISSKEKAQLIGKHKQLESEKQQLEKEYETEKKSLLNRCPRLDNLFTIFYGKSATGKSMFPRVFAKEMGYAYYEVNLNNANTMWHGETERKIRYLLEGIKHLRNAVINFDEMDGQAFVGKTSHSTDTSRIQTAVKNAFQSFVEEYAGLLKEHNIIMFGSTNHPEVLADAIKSRAKQVEITSAISENTIVEVINTSLNELQQSVLMQTNGDVALDFDQSGWTQMVSILKGFGEETLREAGKNFLAGGIDFRHVISELSTMLRRHIETETLIKIRDAFFADNTADKQNWKRRNPRYWQKWDAQGRPSNDPCMVFYDNRLTKENFLSQSRGKTKKFMPPDQAEPVDVYVDGTTEHLMRQQNAQEKNEEKVEQPSMDLFPQPQPEEDLAQQIDTPDFDEAKDEGEQVSITPDKKLKKDNDKIKENEDSVQASTDYYYTVLKKSNLIKKQQTNIKQPVKATSDSEQKPIVPQKPVAPTSLYEIFSIGNFKFVPIDDI